MRSLIGQPQALSNISAVLHLTGTYHNIVRLSICQGNEELQITQRIAKSYMKNLIRSARTCALAIDRARLIEKPAETQTDTMSVILNQFQI